MTTMTFDTHATIKSLQDSGADEPLAEAIVSAIQTGVRHQEDFVTKADLKDSEERMIARMTILEQRMTIRMGAMVFAAAGLAVAAAKLL